MQLTINKSQLRDSLIWVIPLFLYLLSSQFSTINTDGVRDYLETYSIAYESRLPLIGPQMSFTFHIGPLWFYTLSVPLLITKSWAFLSFFVAFLNALKFYVAYKLGQLLFTKEFAIILVSCLLLSSFTLLQQWSFTHTNLVEVSVLMIIYYSYKLDYEKPNTWLILGLLTGVALHVHPTAGVAGYWVFLKLIEGKKIIKNGIIYLSSILLVFAPIIFHQITSNFEDFKAVTTYFTYYTGSYEISSFFKLIYGGIFHISYLQYKILFPTLVAKFLFVIQLLFVVSIMLYGIVLFKNSQFQKLKTFILKLLGFCFFTFVFLFFIRNNTPWYMTYVLTIGFSLLLASVIYLVYLHANLKILPKIFYSLSLIIMSMMIFSLSTKLNSSIQLTEISMNNIRTLNTKLGNSRYEIPAHLANQHGQLTCSQSPVALNGPYAALIFTHSGIEHLSQCGKDGLYYGYSNDMNTIFAVPHFFGELIKIKPTKIIGNSYFYTPKTVYSGNKLNQEQFVSDYGRKRVRIKDWKKTIKTAKINNGSYLVITKQFGFLMELSIKQVKANNQIMTPIAHYDYSSLYYCDSCNPQNTQWDVNYSESVNDKTNIVSF